MEWAERLRVSWGPMLTQHEAARDITFYGSGSRMQAVAPKLVAGKPIKVGWLAVLLAACCLLAASCCWLPASYHLPSWQGCATGALL